uniref:Uncharacterized protein n=1 Tax=Amphiprion percula TaxID=161767 RepID=A0A3P8SWR8_AMPPE
MKAGTEKLQLLQEFRRSAACMFCTENRPGWSDRKCTALNMDGNATNWKHIKIQSVRPHSGTVTCPYMENCVKADASRNTCGTKETNWQSEAFGLWLSRAPPESV